ncbi:MAG: MFS transporter [Alphaproteobacteria bacterium]|nr:MAG: MFS transporter [Alphaproteobacteria bacterium]
MQAAAPQHLLLNRRFWPLFCVQFIGAFCDNIFRNALLMYVTFVLADRIGINSAMMVSMAGGIFILPYFLFSATAGQLADKYEKPFLTRRLKLIEIFLALFAGLSLISNNIYLMLATLFFMGVQSAFFGPIKYSLLPELLREDELVAGNGYIEAGTFIAILLGSICGGLLVVTPNGPEYVTVVLTALSALAFILSRKIQSTGISNAAIKIDFNMLRATWPLIRDAYINTAVWRCVMGISWLWFVGSIYLTMFPSYVKDILHAEETLAVWFMAVFSIGIGIGSILCQRLLRGHISPQFVPLSAAGMTIFGFAIYWFSGADSRLPIILSLLGLSICGGLFSVPLYAILQARSESSHRARIVAANNIINAVCMVGASVYMALLLDNGHSIPHIFLVTAFLGVAVAAYTVQLVRESKDRYVRPPL